MNCSNCGTTLPDGTNTCPNCGALNMSFNQVTASMNDDANSSAVELPVAKVETPMMKEQGVEPVIESSPVQEMPVAPTSSDIIIHNDVPDVVQPSVPAPAQPTAPTTEYTEMGVPVKREHNIFDNDDDEIETLGDEPTINQVDANIAPPTLDVNEENLTKGVSDLGSSNDVSTYEVEPVEETPQERINNGIEKDENSLDIAIPKVESPVDNTGVTSDGSAAEVSVKETVGSMTKEEDLEEKIEVKHKVFNLSFLTKKSFPTPVVLIGMFLVLILGIFMGSVLFSRNVCSVAPRKQEVNNKVVADGKNNVTRSGDYIYKIPESFKYDKTSNGLLIYSEDSTWRIYIRNEIALYDNLAEAKTSIKESLNTQNITVNDIKEMKINNKNYVTIEGTTKTVNRLIAFTSGDNDNVFFIEIVDVDNNYNYDLLEVAQDIINNAKYDYKYSELEKIKVHDIADIAILAAEEHHSRTK